MQKSEQLASPTYTCDIIMYPWDIITYPDDIITYPDAHHGYVHWLMERQLYAVTTTLGKRSEPQVSVVASSVDAVD